MYAIETENIIKQYKKTPIAIFSGHYHAAKIRQQGNIIHVSTPSLVTYPNAFRYVNITNYDDRTIFNFKYMVTGLEDVHKKSKLNVIASAALRGLPSDQETIITIRKSRDNNNDYVEEKTKVTREDRQMQKEAKEAQKEALKQEKIKADELKKLEQAQNKALKDEEKAKTRFYFEGDQLVYIKTIIEDEQELLKVDISNQVDEKLFEIPSDYESE